MCRLYNESPMTVIDLDQTARNRHVESVVTDYMVASTAKAGVWMLW
jgi:hypothetical protein